MNFYFDKIWFLFGHTMHIYMCVCVCVCVCVCMYVCSHVCVCVCVCVYWNVILDSFLFGHTIYIYIYIYTNFFFFVFFFVQYRAVFSRNFSVCRSRAGMHFEVLRGGTSVGSINVSIEV